jgi:hypothetical protein
MASLQTLLNDVKTGFSVDTAVGVQLDAVGKWVGATRFIEQEIVGVWFEWDEDGDPSTLGWDIGYWQGRFDADTAMSALDDETFRLVIYAKIILNRWTGDREGLIQGWNELLSQHGIGLAITDNSDLTIGIFFSGVPDTPVMRSVIERGGLPVKPAGVGAKFHIMAGKAFAWNTQENDVFAGWGTGAWINR